MHPIEFIEKNIRQMMIGEGHTLPVAQGAANAAVDWYRRSSQPTVKSKGIFEDCLREARLYAKRNQEKTKPKAKASKAKA
ncbi:hypothetical protein [Pantoea agglomerans]|uniref:hypothetical protein n=1 Tax=Enterobacter agglomerans TaxID=549 RepID=UPI003C7ED6DA